MGCIVQINSNIYSNRQGAADVMGGIKQGLSIGQMIKSKKVRDKKEADDQAISDIFKKNSSIGEDGKISLDKKSSIAEIYQYDQPKALQMQKQMDSEEANRIKASQEAGDRKLSNQNTRLSIQEKQRALKEKGLPFEQRDEYKKLQSKREYDETEARKKLDRDTLVPGMGYALNADDGKKLKTSKTMKAKFDRQIGELIDLRENKGVEYFDREAVGRGKQLSKDLLLTYKNLAKLGVLSKSDEDIVNAIIPADPLGQDWMPGQDSILHKLKKFKGDLQADYKETLATRLRPKQQSKLEKRMSNYTPEQKQKRYQELLEKQKLTAKVE